MNKKFILVLFIVVAGTGTLIYQASVASAKTVVTVQDLVSSSEARKAIRLGARVTKDPIEYSTNPVLLLKFNVRDIESADSSKIAVQYEGIKPDTLQPGRDVILEGNFDGETFFASSLLTQCPSKYEPPSAPGAGEGSSY